LIRSTRVQLTIIFLSASYRLISYIFSTQIELAFKSFSFPLFLPRGIFTLPELLMLKTYTRTQSQPKIWGYCSHEKVYTCHNSLSQNVHCRETVHAVHFTSPKHFRLDSNLSEGTDCTQFLYQHLSLYGFSFIHPQHSNLYELFRAVYNG
jgi:hypothetical protein